LFSLGDHYGGALRQQHAFVYAWRLFLAWHAYKA
jgi:hypothetical protein